MTCMVIYVYPDASFFFFCIQYNMRVLYNAVFHAKSIGAAKWWTRVLETQGSHAFTAVNFSVVCNCWKSHKSVVSLEQINNLMHVQASAHEVSFLSQDHVSQDLSEYQRPLQYALESCSGARILGAFSLQSFCCYFAHVYLSGANCKSPHKFRRHTLITLYRRRCSNYSKYLLVWSRLSRVATCKC